MLIDTIEAAVVLKLTDPETAPNVAEIELEPTPSAVARPLEPDALLTDTSEPFEVDQRTEEVKVWVELSV